MFKIVPECVGLDIDADNGVGAELRDGEQQLLPGVHVQQLSCLHTGRSYCGPDSWIRHHKQLDMADTGLSSGKNKNGNLFDEDLRRLFAKLILSQITEIRQGQIKIGSTFCFHYSPNGFMVSHTLIYLYRLPVPIKLTEAVKSVIQKYKRIPVVLTFNFYVKCQCCEAGAARSRAF